MKRQFSRMLLTVLLTGLLFVLFSAGTGVYAYNGEQYVIVLDPGHGGKDTGTCEAKNPEAYYDLRVAKACKAALERDGRFKVYLTRSEDEDYLTLMERGMFADSVNADLLVSIHFDGSTNTALRGCSAYTSVLDKFDKATLADRILREIVEKTGIPRAAKDLNRIKDHGDKIYYWSEALNWSLPDLPSTGPVRDYYGIIKWCCYFGIDSLIVEHAFMSSAADRALVEKPETLTALGEADAAAIIAYFTGCDHQFEAVRDYPSNCMMPGKKSERCRNCGCRRNTAALTADSNAHIWLESEKKQASCTADGYIEYTCEITRAMNVGKEGWVDNHTYKKVLPALGHSYQVTAETPAGHGFDGLRVHTCTRCGDSYEELLKGEPHDYQEQSPVAPTCETAGYTPFVCTICSEERRESPLEALGHQYEKQSETPATCLEEGAILERCSRCDGERSIPIPPLGHDEGEPEETLPSCTADGVRRYTCARCGNLREELLPATGHTLTDPVELPPTCEEDGQKEGVCSVCGETVTEITAPAVGHSFIEGDEVPPTCEEDGYRTRICTVCGARETIPGDPATGHQYMLAETILSGCNEPQKEVFHCHVCWKEKIVVSEEPPAGHSYVDREDPETQLLYRVCEWCGEKDPDFTPIPIVGTWEGLLQNPMFWASIFGVLVLVIVGVVLKLSFGKARGFITKIIEEEEAEAETEEEPKTPDALPQQAAQKEELPK